MSTFRFNKGLYSAMPVLELGQLYFCENTNQWFIGTSSGNLEITSQGFDLSNYINSVDMAATYMSKTGAARPIAVGYVKNNSEISTMVSAMQTSVLSKYQSLSVTGTVSSISNNTTYSLVGQVLTFNASNIYLVLNAGTTNATSDENYCNTESWSITQINSLILLNITYLYRGLIVLLPGRYTSIPNYNFIDHYCYKGVLFVAAYSLISYSYNFKGNANMMLHGGTGLVVTRRVRANMEFDKTGNILTVNSNQCHWTQGMGAHLYFKVNSIIVGSGYYDNYYPGIFAQYNDNNSGRWQNTESTFILENAKVRIIIPSTGVSNRNIIFSFVCLTGSIIFGNYPSTKMILKNCDLDSTNGRYFIWNDTMDLEFINCKVTPVSNLMLTGSGLKKWRFSLKNTEWKTTAYNPLFNFPSAIPTYGKTIELDNVIATQTTTPYSSYYTFGGGSTTTIKIQRPVYTNVSGTETGGVVITGNTASGLIKNESVI